MKLLPKRTAAQSSARPCYLYDIRETLKETEAKQEMQLKRDIYCLSRRGHASGAQTVLSTGSARKTAFTRGSATAASTLSFPPCV